MNQTQLKEAMKRVEDKLDKSYRYPVSRWVIQAMGPLPGNTPYPKADYDSHYYAIMDSKDRD